LLHGIQVEALELLGVVEVLAHGIGQGEFWCRIFRFN
jgi:hypothetical protein